MKNLRANPNVSLGELYELLVDKELEEKTTAPKKPRISHIDTLKNQRKTNPMPKRIEPRRQYLVRKTKQLSVRPLESTDYNSWKTAWTTMQPKQNEWDTANKAPTQVTRAAFKKILQTHKKWQKNDQFYDLGIFDMKTNELLGFVAIMDVTRKLFQNAYLGYRIFNPHWGKGVATTAVKQAIDIAFKDLKLHRLEAGIAPMNARSIKLAKRLKLRKEGACPRRLFLNQKWQDMLIFAITSEDVGIKWRPPRNMAPRVQ